MNYSERDINKITFSWLNSINGISNGIIGKFIEYFKTSRNIWYNFVSEKDNINFINENMKTQLIRKKNEFPEIILEKIKKEHVSIITIFDNNYPNKLKNIKNPPYILYAKGEISSFEGILIAVVGSRKATNYGKWVTEKLTKELAEMGVIIVSGFANGLDTIAHKTAIKYNTKTVAVLGSGIDIIYPKKNRNIYNEVISNGMIITEQTFGMSPLASNFPNRNRIISGLCEGVLIVEAKEKSGTLITASHAAEQGREVFAVPGNIDSIYSKGTNKLIKDGAKITTNINDICEEIISLKNRLKNIKKIQMKQLNKQEEMIIKLLMSGEKTIFDLSQSLDIKVSEILSILTILEMKGYIRQMNGKKFMLANF